MRKLGPVALFVILAVHDFAMPARAHGQDSRSRPLEQAILRGNVDAVRQLVTRGEPVDQRMFRNETPLLMAASVGAWDVVLYLLSEGADPKLLNLSGTSLSDYVRSSRIAPNTQAGRALARVKTHLRRRRLL